MTAVQLPLVEAPRSGRRPRRYGVPYLGSKNRLAREIVALLPPAEHFYDLFAGGCAVTHAALESGKWKTVHANDADPMGIDLFMGAVRGGYRDERRAVDRETFMRLKAVDPYVRWCWSFGSNGKEYLWNRKEEAAKLYAFRACVASGCGERREALRALFGHLESSEAKIGNVEHLESVQRLEAVRSLEGAVDLSRLEATSADYRRVGISPVGAVLFCDIPYRGTKYTYTSKFDHEAFYAWAEATPNVWIFEYSMPEDRFEIVWERDRTCSYSATNNSKKTVERLWRPKRRTG